MKIARQGRSVRGGHGVRAGRSLRGREEREKREVVVMVVQGRMRRRRQQQQQQQQQRWQRMGMRKGVRRGGVIRSCLGSSANSSSNASDVRARAVQERQRLERTELEERRVPQHPDLFRGTLGNGLRYCLLPNKVPPQRFEAHLEVHVGSVDETSEEQGMAHMVEHVTFLGSRRRERLLGTGSRSNAYTDFHHTVFHVHAPLQSVNGVAMMPQVLEALHEIAFAPEFLSSRIKKERLAVLSEAQMMNTIDYRTDCTLLQYLHHENALGYRFPIGLEQQIRSWPEDKMREFHERWYFPANATLYIVGDFTDTAEVNQLVHRIFGEVPPGREPDGKGSLRRRHMIRPPVLHEFGYLYLRNAAKADAIVPNAVKPNIFQHQLIQQFTLSVFCKLAVQPVTSYEDLRRLLMLRIVIQSIIFRVNKRYQTDAPFFNLIEFDHSDSGREGCAVSTLTVCAEPSDWREATIVAVQEMRRLARFGVTNCEMERYKEALVRDSEQLAEQRDSVPSAETLDFLMESDATGHIVMDQVTGHEATLAVIDELTLREVNEIAASILSFASDYGTTKAVPVYHGSEPTSEATAIIACVPETMLVVNEDGTHEEQPFTVTSEDIEEVLRAEGVDVWPEEDVVVPEHLIPDETIQAKEAMYAPCFVDVPRKQHEMQEQALLGSSIINGAGLGDVERLAAQRSQSMRVVQRRLQNGIKLNYRVTSNEPKAAVLRVVAEGGRLLEGLGMGSVGAVSVGTRALSETGDVGEWKRDQTEIFCLSRLINCIIEANEEFMYIDFHFAVGEGGLRAVMELVHLLVESPDFTESAFERAKQSHMSNYRGINGSLERTTSDRLLRALLDNDNRFLEPSIEELEALSSSEALRAIRAQLVAPNLEVNVVGDFDAAELEEAALRYLGTVEPSPSFVPPVPLPIQYRANSPVELRNQQLHMDDSDPRACSYIIGRAPSRWDVWGTGSTSGPSSKAMGQYTYASRPESAIEALRELGFLGAEVNPVQVALSGGDPRAALGQLFKDPKQEAQAFAAADERRRNHPLYGTVCLSLVAEIVNSRLFTTVRDALGLTYDVSFELNTFDLIEGGWYIVSVTSTPENSSKALAASLKVLRSLGQPGEMVTQREIERARRTRLTQHESDLKDNGYWLQLMTHLQSPLLPRKDISCLSDLKLMYEAATVEDVQNAYAQLRVGEEDVHWCVGVSGSSAPSTTSPAM